MDQSDPQMGLEHFNKCSGKFMMVHQLFKLSDKNIMHKKRQTNKFLIYQISVIFKSILAAPFSIYVELFSNEIVLCEKHLL